MCVLAAQCILFSEIPCTFNFILIHSPPKHVVYGNTIFCPLTIERDTVIVDERPESLRFIFCHIGPYFIKKRTKNQSVQI